METNLPRWISTPGKYHGKMQVSLRDYVSYGWDWKRKQPPICSFSGFEIDEGMDRTNLVWLGEGMKLMINHVAEQIGRKDLISHEGAVNESAIERRVDGAVIFYKIPIYLNATADKQKYIILKAWHEGAGKYSHAVEIPKLVWYLGDGRNLAAMAQFEHVCFWLANVLQTLRWGDEFALEDVPAVVPAVVTLDLSEKVELLWKAHAELH